MSTKIPTIHRDHTFVFNGELYQLARMGPYGSGDSCWDVWRESDMASAGQFYSLADLRALMKLGVEQGWPDLIEVDEDTLSDFAK